MANKYYNPDYIDTDTVYNIVISDRDSARGGYTHPNPSTYQQTRPMTKGELNAAYGVMQTVYSDRMELLLKKIVEWKYDKKPQIAKLTNRKNELIGYVITTSPENMQEVEHAILESDALNSGFELRKVGDL